MNADFSDVHIEPRKQNTRQQNNVSGCARRKSGQAMRRMREDHLRSGGENGSKPFPFPVFRKRRPSKVQSGSHPFQSGFGKPPRKDRIRLQWYPCPATAHAMGAARRDPRRGEIPGADRQIWFCQPPKASGGVVSNTDGIHTKIDLRNHGEHSAIFGMLPVLVRSSTSGELVIYIIFKTERRKEL